MEGHGVVCVGGPRNPWKVGILKAWELIRKWVVDEMLMKEGVTQPCRAPPKGSNRSSVDTRGLVYTRWGA